MLFSLVSTLPCLTAAALPFSRALSSELLVLLKLAQLECVRVGSVHINHSSIWSASSWALHMHAPLLHLCAALTLLECPETSSWALEEVITRQQQFSSCICAAESQKHVTIPSVYRNNTCFLICKFKLQQNTITAKFSNAVYWTWKFKSTCILLQCLICGGCKALLN